MPADASTATRFGGLGLVEAFRKLVLEDSEIASLGEVLGRHDERHKDVFRDGQYPGWFVDHRWPMDVTSEDLAFNFVRPFMIVIPGPPLPEPSSEARKVSELIVKRIKTLREWLIAGDLVAYGTYERTGTFDPIHRLQWARQGIAIDIKSGDFLREVENKMIVQWTGLALEAPLRASSEGSREAFHVNSTAYDEVRRDRTTRHEDQPKRITPARASILQAAASLWPEGIPDGLQVKVRDQRIMEWQREHGLTVASAKSIQRHLGSLSLIA
jgi:hypothetical protein